MDVLPGRVDSGEMTCTSVYSARARLGCGCSREVHPYPSVRPSVVEEEVVGKEDDTETVGDFLESVKE